MLTSINQNFVSLIIAYMLNTESDGFKTYECKGAFHGHFL